jgi:hypothetical protein
VRVFPNIKRVLASRVEDGRVKIDASSPVGVAEGFVLALENGDARAMVQAVQTTNAPEDLEELR